MSLRIIATEKKIQNANEQNRVFILAGKKWLKLLKTAYS